LKGDVTMEIVKITPKMYAQLCKEDGKDVTDRRIQATNKVIHRIAELKREYHNPDGSIKEQYK